MTELQRFQFQKEIFLKIIWIFGRRIAISSANFQKFKIIYSTYGLIMWSSHLLLILIRLEMTKIWPQSEEQAFLPTPPGIISPKVKLVLHQRSPYNIFHLASKYQRLSSIKGCHPSKVSSKNFVLKSTGFCRSLFKS